MSEDTSNNTNVRNDEIDLLDLFRRMGRALSRLLTALGKAFLVTVIFLLRRWLPLTLSILAGLVISILMWQTTESFYTADLILKVNIQPTDEVIAHVNRLQTYCLEAKKDRLAEAIGLTPAQTDNIKEIKAYWIIDNGHNNIPDYTDYDDEHDVYDTVNVRMDDRLDVRVRILQPQELSNVRDGILNFINSDPLFKQRNELRLRQNTELLARIETDINQLDSLQRFKYFEESRNLLPRTGQMVFLQEQKTQLLHEDIYKLYTRKQSLEMECNLYKDIVTVLSEFNVPVERDNSGLYYSKTFIPLFFLITLLILIFRANRKKLREVYEKY
jgi:hypothetical protein